MYRSLHEYFFTHSIVRIEKNQWSDMVPCYYKKVILYHNVSPLLSKRHICGRQHLPTPPWRRLFLVRWFTLCSSGGVKPLCFTSCAVSCVFPPTHGCFGKIWRYQRETLRRLGICAETAQMTTTGALFRTLHRHLGSHTSDCLQPALKLPSSSVSPAAGDSLP